MRMGRITMAALLVLAAGCLGGCGSGDTQTASRGGGGNRRRQPSPNVSPPKNVDDFLNSDAPFSALPDSALPGTGQKTPKNADDFLNSDAPFSALPDSSFPRAGENPPVQPGTNVTPPFNPQPGAATVPSGGNAGGLQQLADSDGRTLITDFADIRALAVTPDGSTLLVAGTDISKGAVELWDAGTRKRVHTLATEGYGINSLSMSRDGRMLAAAGGSQIKVWDLPGRRLLQTIDTGVKEVSSVALSPDGRTVAMAAPDDDQIRIYNTSSGEMQLAIDEQESGVEQIVFSPDGTMLAGAETGEGVKLWNPVSGEMLRSFEGNGSCTYVAFSSDGKQLAAACRETIFTWDVASGNRLQSLTNRHHRPAKLLFVSAARLVSCGSTDGTLHVWNLETGQLDRVLWGHTGSVSAAAVLPDGNTLISGDSERGRLKLWDLKRAIDDPTAYQTVGQERASFVVSLDGLGVQAMAVTPDGRTAVTNRREVEAWDLHSVQVQRVLSQSTGSPALAISPDGSQVACYDNLYLDYKLKVFAVDSGKELQAIPFESEPIALAFADGGRTLLAATGNQLFGWELASGQQRFALTVTSEKINALRVLPGGKRAATAAEDGSVKIWDLEAQQLVHELKHPENVSTLAVSPDGTRLAAATGKFGADAVVVWDAETGRKLGSLEFEFQGSINALAFTPDGSALIYPASNDLVVWQLATGKETRRLFGHLGPITAIQPLPDGRTLATASQDGTVKLWDLQAAGN